MEEKTFFTIDDVARELGVSKTTVSRALSGKGRISEQTTQRVREFVEKHNFSPNVMARGLAQSKTYNLAMILPEDYGENEVSFFKEVMNGICKVAGENNYDIMISMLDGQLERMLNNHKVDGVILTRSVVDSADQKYLKARGIPFVVVGSGTEPGVLYVDNNNRLGCEELTTFLIKKGFTNISLIGGLEEFEVTQSRKEGFLAAFKNAGAEVCEPSVVMGVDSYIKASYAVDKVINRKTDCIVCMDDYVCNLVLENLHEKRIRIPEDVCVASLYDSGRLAHYQPTITSLHFSTKALGKRACGELLNILKENVEVDTEAINFRIEERESTLIMEED